MCKGIFLCRLFISLSLLSWGTPALYAQARRETTIPEPAAETWMIRADHPDPSDYFGITVANGMLGLVSSPEPFKMKDIVLNGAFDLYGRGRVGNILKTFHFLDMFLDVDGERIGGHDQVSGMRQAMLNGFGGLSIIPSGIVQRTTKLPARWKSLTLTGIGPERRTYQVR